MNFQNQRQNDADLFLSDEDYREANKSPLHTLRVSRFLSTEDTFVEIYNTRITIIKKPKIAVWEHKETYHVMDMGDIIVNKGMFRSTLEVRRRNSGDHLFILHDLKHAQAYRFKEILNMMIVKRQKFMFNLNPTPAPQKYYAQMMDP